MADESSDLSRMNEVIAEFCEEVVLEPLCYFSEADLQGILFQKLTRAFPAKVETSYSRGPNSKGKYRTGLVHREYGATGRRRTDISVFSPDDMAVVDSPRLMVRGHYIVPRFAVELGTEKTVDTIAHITNDLKKLSRAKECGYLVHFFKDVTQADPGTAQRARTEEKLNRIFRGPAVNAAPPAHVHYLCFLLRLARKSKTIRGKCELLVHGSGTWSKVNLTRVRDDILALLERRETTYRRIKQMKL